jgi:hypothetical protein
MQLAQRSRICPVGGENSASTEFYFLADFFFDKIGRTQWKSVGFQKLDPIFGDIRGILEPCVPHETDGWRFSVAARFQKQLQLSSIGHLYLSDVRC